MTDFTTTVARTAEALSADARELLCDLYEAEEIDVDTLYEPTIDELVLAGLARVSRPARCANTYLEFERSRFAIAVHDRCPKQERASPPSDALGDKQR